MTHHINCDVPQGSILDLILFIIYLNDIPNLLICIIYADDTSLALSGKNVNDLIWLLNKELDLLYIWLQSNKLSLNTQSAFYILFHRARIKCNNLVVKINDCVLTESIILGILV